MRTKLGIPCLRCAILRLRRKFQVGAEHIYIIYNIGRNGSMYIGCIYLPIQGTCVNHVEECYEKLSVDLSVKEESYF